MLVALSSPITLTTVRVSKDHMCYHLASFWKCNKSSNRKPQQKIEQVNTLFRTLLPCQIESLVAYAKV